MAIFPTSGLIGCADYSPWTLADVGIVVNVFMAILIGSFTLAMLAPETQGQSEHFVDTALFSHLL